MKDTKFFKSSEFECQCGCGTNNMSQEFVDKLTEARALAGVPFKITSGSRCKSHNADVGGVPGSSHVLGYAADIKAETGTAKYKTVKALMEAGFERIGVGRSFIHVDMDPAKPKPTVWLY